MPGSPVKMPVTMKTRNLLFSLVVLISVAYSTGLSAEEKIKILLIDGQNNHSWQTTSPVMEAIYEDSGRFSVDVSTSPPSAPKGPRPPKGDDPAKKEAFKKAMLKWQADSAKSKKENQAKWEAWRPAFEDYDVVVSNYNGELWPDEVQKSFDEYVKGGGGFVAVHAANNSFPQWKAYNRMIAVGGWGGRSELSGPYIRLRDGKFVNDTTAGRGGSHGSKHEFVVVTRAAEHPIMKGLPTKWLHASDELYDRLRGPAEKVTVLATAFSEESTRGSGEDEPMLMTIDFGKGRVFHTTLGHDTTAMSCVGFQETLKRGTEWAATGKVTLPADAASGLNPDRVTTRTLETAGAGD